MVMVFNGDPHILQVEGHLGAQVEQLVFWGDGVIAAMKWNVVAVAALGTVPVGLAAVDLIRSTVYADFVFDIIENIEFKFRSPARFIGNASILQEFLGADGNVT